MALEAKIFRLQREEAPLVRLVNASLGELTMLLKLNPMPKSRVQPRTEYLGPDADPVDNPFKKEETEGDANQEQTGAAPRFGSVPPIRESGPSVPASKATRFPTNRNRLTSVYLR